MSETRKVYIGRLIGRCVIFVICLFMYLFRRDFFTVLDGMNFFKEFSLLHLLWGVWVVDMTLQIIPIKNKVPLGSQKLFPVVSNLYGKRSIARRCETTSYPPQKRLYKVFILWCLLIAGIGVLYCFGVIDKVTLFMISVFFLCV